MDKNELSKKIQKLMKEIENLGNEVTDSSPEIRFVGAHLCQAEVEIKEAFRKLLEHLHMERMKADLDR